jgi:hypothetical protein
MARLNVNRAIVSRYFAEQFQVIRRVETVGADGMAVLTPQATVTATGVVNMASPSQLQRIPESEQMQRTLSIVTGMRLTGAAPGLQPDIVVWNGGNYIVQDVQPYVNYGPGFVEVLAGSNDYQVPQP